VLYTQGFALIIGKLHGLRDVGLYNRAYSTQALPANIMGSMMARIALPLFATRAEDTGALRRGIRMANSLAMIVNLPAMLGLTLLADLVVITLFGDQWLPVAPILAVLALGGILLPIHVDNLQLLLAQGGSRRFFKLELIKKSGGTVRIYFSPRDEQGRSQASYIEVAADDLQRVLKVHDEPLLELGEIGAFDDSGIMPSCLVEARDKVYLYYIGWNRGVTVPFRNSIGPPSLLTAAALSSAPPRGRFWTDRRPTPISSARPS
jgi:hypothetical protein